MSELQPFQQRVVDEKAELDERLSKLGAFFDTAVFDSLDALEKQRMKSQHDFMSQYSRVLGERIDAFG